MAHPIENIMSTTMESLRAMVDVNTVVGTPVQTPDGSTIIPISQLSFGYVAGGGEYATESRSEPKPGDSLPFAGGTGAGVSVKPLGFLVLCGGQVKMLATQHDTSLDRLIDMAPTLIENVQRFFTCEDESPTADYT